MTTLKTDTILPKVGSDFDKEYFGDVNIGEIFRLRPDNQGQDIS